MHTRGIRITSETMYYCFICLLIFMYMFEASAWDGFSDSMVHDFVQFSALGCAFISIWQRKYTLKELTQIILLNLTGILCYISSGNTGLLMTMLAVTLMPHGTLDKTLCIIFIEEIGLFVLIVVLSILGILSSDTYIIAKGTYDAAAKALGFGHPNMFAAQAGSLIFLYLCVNRKSLTFEKYAIAILGG